MRQRGRIDTALINIGREKGYITYSDINNALPGEMVSTEEIDDILGALEELDIQILAPSDEDDIDPMEIDCIVDVSNVVPEKDEKNNKLGRKRMLYSG